MKWLIGSESESKNPPENSCKNLSIYRESLSVTASLVKRILQSQDTERVNEDETDREDKRAFGDGAHSSDTFCCFAK